MKTLHVLAAGFGWHTFERAGVKSIAGMRFAPAPSAFPALTCVAQANLRTGRTPFEHGLWSNGWWSEQLQKPIFWEQSARLVKGARIWDERRAIGDKVGMFFFQQSLGESVDAVISPAPIHKHGGGMIMSSYVQPQAASELIARRCGDFPLYRYWGPLASPKVGRKVIDYFETLSEAVEVDEAYLYLPTLDYYAQKYGPDSPEHLVAIKEFVHQVERLAEFAARKGCELRIAGDYEITGVNAVPVSPNVMLRRAGLFKVREIKGMAYPDFYSSTAFAMCDHELCIVYGREREAAVKLLLASGEFERPEGVVTTEGLLLAKRGSWCEYKWWTDRREAPDFAAHVDIHNKPGYDPTELFFFGRGTVRGTHGRQCEVARSE